MGLKLRACGLSISLLRALPSSDGRSAPQQLEPVSRSLQVCFFSSSVVHFPSIPRSVPHHMVLSIQIFSFLQLPFPFNFISSPTASRLPDGVPQPSNLFVGSTLPLLLCGCLVRRGRVGGWCSFPCSSVASPRSGGWLAQVTPHLRSRLALSPYISQLRIQFLMVTRPCTHHISPRPTQRIPNHPYHAQIRN